MDVRLGFPSECALRHTADRHLSWKASLVSGGQSLATTSIKRCRAVSRLRRPQSNTTQSKTTRSRRGAARSDGTVARRRGGPAVSGDTALGPGPGGDLRVRRPVGDGRVAMRSRSRSRERQPAWCASLTRARVRPTGGTGGWWDGAKRTDQRACRSGLVVLLAWWLAGAVPLRELACGSCSLVGLVAC